MNADPAERFTWPALRTPPSPVMNLLLRVLWDAHMLAAPAIFGAHHGATGGLNHLEWSGE